MPNILLVTYAGQTVTPLDDALVYETAVNQSGMIYGGTVTIKSANLLHITSGHGIVCGRKFTIFDSDIQVPLSSSGTLLGRLYVQLDLSNTGTPIQLLVETGESLTPVQQDQHVNIQNGVYEFNLATFSVSTSTIASLVDVAPSAEPSTGAGSVVTVTTTETSLIGKMCTLTDGTNTLNANFDNDMTATFYGVQMVGTVIVNATDGEYVASGQINITYFGMYSVAIAFWGAPINITTTTTDFYGQSIEVQQDGVSVGTISFDGSGNASYLAPATGVYTFSVTYGGETYSSSVTVSEETTYSVSIDTVNVTLNTDCSVLEGLTVTATNGVDTETATITNGVAEFSLDAGDWEVAGIPMTIVSGNKYTEQLVNFAYHYTENDSNYDSGDYPSGYDNSSWTDPFYVDLSSGTPHYGDWDPEGTNADKLKWFYPKSCMLLYNGTVDYYLNEDDETKKADGTASDVANTSYGGNAMMEWGQDGKRIYWKIVPDSDSKGFTYVVGNNNVDADMKPWNHYDANDNVNNHFYMSKYFGSVVSGKMRSISGQSNFVDNTRNTEVTYALANNPSGSNIWYTEVYSDWLFQAMMCWLISKSTNSQTKFGYGRCASGNSSAIGQGTMNGTGMFYGSSNQTSGVKVFGRENPWGNLWRGLAGLMYVSNVVKVKLTYGTADGTSTTGYNFDGSGYKTLGSIGGTNGGYISHMQIADNILAPSTMSGSESTYYTDGGWYASGTMYAIVGGDWAAAGYGGAFCCNLSNAASFTYSNRGAALSCKPLAQ